MVLGFIAHNQLCNSNCNFNNPNFISIPMTRKTFILPGDKTRSRILTYLFQFLSELNDNVAWRIEICRYRKRRTDNQNRCLWGLAYSVLLNETGQEPEDWHEYFCGEFFGWEEKTIFGRKYSKPIRTTTTDEDGKRNVISTELFSQFYGFIQYRCAQNGILIPDPDPLHHEAR